MSAPRPDGPRFQPQAQQAPRFDAGRRDGPRMDRRADGPRVQGDHRNAGRSDRRDHIRGDWNHNGKVDNRFDRNKDGQIDRRWDRNNDDRIDRRVDSNRNGRFDRREWRHWRGGHGPWLNNRNWWRDNWWIYSASIWNVGYYDWPYGYSYNRWSYGDILPSAFFISDYYIDDWWSYDLYEPPYGYQWIRVGPDILLVDPVTGRIVQVISGAFY
jgi:Ni/Co efflux regulator RcnB